MTAFGHRIPAWASLIVWALLWEAAGWTHLTLLLPPLSSVAAKLAEIVPTEGFMDALALTARAFVLGTAIAVLAGVPIGMSM